MVSAQLKNISQTGNLPQVGGEHKKVFETTNQTSIWRILDVQQFFEPPRHRDSLKPVVYTFSPVGKPFMVSPSRIVLVHPEIFPSKRITGFSRGIFSAKVACLKRDISEVLEAWA